MAALARLAILSLLFLGSAQGQLDDSIPGALVGDDACDAEGAGSEACNLGMIQRRKSAETAVGEEAAADGEADAAGLSEEEAERQALSLEEVSVEDWETEAGAAGSEPEASADGKKPLALPVIFGYKRSVPGVEACHGGNLGYCNSLMYRARGYCGGASCVQIVNPVHHRTRTPLHIHSYHYNGHGASLKHRMETAVCSKGGWVKGGFPCGGKAKFFLGYPAVFSVAQGAGSIDHASITVWPGSCHGGTIVLVGWHCSIEHSISRR